MPRSTIVPTSDSNCSFTFPCSKTATVGLIPVAEYVPPVLGLDTCEEMRNSVEFVADDSLIGFFVFLLRRHHDFRRKRRRGRLLVPSDLFEVVPHILLVEGWLRFSGDVLVRGPEA